jgi:hypothetical protein
MLGLGKSGKYTDRDCLIGPEGRLKFVVGALVEVKDDFFTMTGHCTKNWQGCLGDQTQYPRLTRPPSLLLKV